MECHSECPATYFCTINPDFGFAQSLVARLSVATEVLAHVITTFICAAVTGSSFPTSSARPSRN